MGDKDDSEEGLDVVEMAEGLVDDVLEGGLDDAE